MSSDTEVKLAKRVIRFLEKQDYITYKEVMGPDSDFVCDIFAVKFYNNGKVQESWAVEVKQRFGLAVMEQATRWRKHAHKASIATPMPSSRRARSFGLHVCALLGIGVIEITSSGAKEILKPKQGTPAGKLPELREEQKKSEAGSSKRDHWTPFKLTVDALVEYVRQHPNVHLKEAIRNIPHHYKNERSAFSSLLKYIDQGIIPLAAWGSQNNPRLLIKTD